MTDPTGPEQAQDDRAEAPTAAAPADPVVEDPDAGEAPQDGPDDDTVMRDVNSDTAHQADDDEAGDDTADDTGDPASRARKEARRLRQRLRDTEAMRDEAVAQIEAAHRERDDALAAADTARARVTAAETRRAEETAVTLGLVDGRDLWRDGRQLADFLDEDGRFDPGKVAGTVREIQSTTPHLVRRTLGGSVNPRMSAAQLIAHGVQPALDAPAEEWDQWRVARARLARGGATVAGQQAPAAPTWSDVLRAAAPDTDR